MSLHLLNLKLDGFGSYDKLDQDLNDLGPVFISGPTGSGKSTIPLAIHLLLFGKPLRKKSEFVTVKDYINKILDSGYDILLQFLQNEHRCEIREIRGRKSDVESEQNGLYFTVDGIDKRGKTDTETRQNITEFLSISAEDFQNIAILSRRQSQKLITGTSADRSKVLVEVFGIEKYDIYVDSCQDYATELKKRSKSLSVKIEEYKESIVRLNESFEAIENVEDVSQDEIDGLVDKINKIKGKLEKIRNLESENKSLLDRVDLIKKHNMKAVELDKRIAELKDSIEHEEQQDYPKDKSMVEWQQNLGMSKTNLSALKRDRDTIKSDILSIKSNKNICPVNKKDCSVKIPEKHNDQMVKEKQGLVDEKEVEIKVLVEEIEQLHGYYSSVEYYDKIVTELKQKESVRKEYDVEDVPDVEEKKAELEKCREAITKGDNRLEELREQKSNLSAKKTLHEEMKNLRESLLSDINNKQKELASVEENLEKADEDVKYLVAAASIFKRAKMYKIDLVLELLNNNANEVLNRISDGERSVEIRSRKKDSRGKRVLDKLGIIVHDSYKSLPIELVSDGQEAQVGLAILLGLWKTSNSLSNKAVSSLFLDEVFGPLDDVTVANVFESIVEVVKELGTKSIFVISHKRLDARLFDYKWKTSTTDGISNLEVEAIS